MVTSTDISHDFNIQGAIQDSLMVRFTEVERVKFDWLSEKGLLRCYRFSPIDTAFSRLDIIIARIGYQAVCSEYGWPMPVHLGNCGHWRC